MREAAILLSRIANTDYQQNGRKSMLIIGANVVVKKHVTHAALHALKCAHLLIYAVFRRGSL